MNWKNLFTPVKNMTPAEAKALLDRLESGEYQLLDVRQPKEYEAGHLPGATLIPLKELPARLDELDKEKPVIAYCASGNRSKAAAQLLIGRDFAQVYNLSGGIKAWDGRKAVGPEEAGLDFFTGAMDYEDGVSLAYAMEDGLQRFYFTLADRAAAEEQKKLYIRLAGFEDKHKARLLAQYRRTHPAGETPRPAAGGVMEGGRRIEDFLKRVNVFIETKRDILEFAMMLETQALDLYGRMARKSKAPDTRELFLALADEEKMHLSYLVKELEKTL